MCPSGGTCLPMDCCYSKLSLQNLTKRAGLVQNRNHHHLVEMQSNKNYRFVVSFFFTGNTLTSNHVLYGVTSGFIFSTDQSAVSLLNI